MLRAAHLFETSPAKERCLLTWRRYTADVFLQQKHRLRCASGVVFLQKFSEKLV